MEREKEIEQAIIKMAREKEIEKMKNEIISIPCKADCPYDGQITPCMKCFMAFLVDKGYRKIPKGAVVLTKEEYERLKKEELYAQGKYNLCHGDRGIAGTVKTTERLGQTLIEYDRRVREAYDKIIPELIEKNKQILNRLLNMCYDGNHPRNSITAGEIRYIAKTEYGIEVE